MTDYGKITIKNTDVKVSDKIEWETIIEYEGECATGKGSTKEESLNDALDVLLIKKERFIKNAKSEALASYLEELREIEEREESLKRYKYLSEECKDYSL